MHSKDKYPRITEHGRKRQHQPFPAEKSPSAHGTQPVQQRLLCCFNSCPGLHVLEQLKAVTFDKKHVQHHIC